MNKKEMLQALSSETGLTKRAVEDVMAAMCRTIGKELVMGNTVTFSGFGSFKPVDRPERKARNPKSGESVTVAPRRVARFVPGKELRELLKRAA